MAPVHGPAALADARAYLDARFASAAGAGRGLNKIFPETESMRESLRKMESGEIADKAVFYGPRIYSLWRARGREPRGALSHMTAANAVRDAGFPPLTSTLLLMPSDANPQAFCGRLIEKLDRELVASEEIKAMIGGTQSEAHPINQIQTSETGVHVNFTSRDVTDLLGPCVVAVSNPDDARIVICVTCFLAGWTEDGEGAPDVLG